jgi:F0F1-type ATP synthase assembly protein I
MSLNEIDPLAEGAGAQAPVEPKVARSGPVQKREPLYFVVILLLIADIMLGLGIAVFAEKVMDFRPMAVGGLGLAGLGLGILAYFVLFGSGRPKK